VEKGAMSVMWFTVFQSRMVLRKKGRWILERPCKSGDFYLRLFGQEDSHAHISNNYNKPIGPLLTCCGELCGCR
jgi:hypothetical protein